MTISPWQEGQRINSELGPRNENQQMATQELTAYVNEVRREASYRGQPGTGERQVQQVMHELAEQGITVQTQQGWMTDQYNRPMYDQYQRPIPVTNYVPFRQQPQYAEPYYGTPPIAPPYGGAVPPPVWVPSPRCQGIDLGVRIPLGNGAAIGFNMPLIEGCRRERDEWVRQHRR
jgi:hypothetical protein